MVIQVYFYLLSLFVNSSFYLINSFAVVELRDEATLSAYICIVSRLTSCLQFVHAAQDRGEDEDSDGEDMDTIPDFKAAEQDVRNQSSI